MDNRGTSVNNLTNEEARDAEARDALVVSCSEFVVETRCASCRRGRNVPLQYFLISKLEGRCPSRHGLPQTAALSQSAEFTLKLDERQTMTKAVSLPASMLPLLAWMAVCLGAAGCGGGGLDTVAVSGTVTFDGKPLENGIVRFVPVGKDGLLATGQLRTGGQFTLATKGTDGAMIGEYKVSVQSAIIDADVPEKDRELGIGGKQSAIPEKYNNPDSSGLTEKIDGGRTITIELKSE